MRPRSVFFGTPEFAVPTLSMLNQVSEVVGVVSQPDRPRGRGLQLGAPEVVVRARELGLDVFQPVRVRDGALEAWLRERRPELAVVIAYGRILPGAVLRVPARGCVNLHASLLPAYRGSAPIQWALLSGERTTGISLMQMDEGMDTGPVYARHELTIGPQMNAGELTQALATLAAQVLAEHFDDLVAGRLQAVPQDHALATHAPPIRSEQLAIDWSAPASRVHDQVRAFAPRPGAFTWSEGKRLKVLETRVADTSGAPGTVLEARADNILVGCGAGSVRVLRAQAEGRRVQEPRELVNGRIFVAGQWLGAG